MSLHLRRIEDRLLKSLLVDAGTYAEALRELAEDSSIPFREKDRIICKLLLCITTGVGVRDSFPRELLHDACCRLEVVREAIPRNDRHDGNGEVLQEWMRRIEFHLDSAPEDFIEEIAVFEEMVLLFLAPLDERLTAHFFAELARWAREGKLERQEAAWHLMYECVYASAGCLCCSRESERHFAETLEYVLAHWDENPKLFVGACEATLSFVGCKEVAGVLKRGYASVTADEARAEIAETLRLWGMDVRK